MLKRTALVAALLTVLGLASLTWANERPRYTRGTGLSGLGNPCCGRTADWCPGCPPVVGTGYGWGDPCRGGMCRDGRLGWGWPGLGHGGVPAIQPGPPTAAITYPYYTVRGPRDFLQRNPTPIGP